VLRDNKKYTTLETRKEGVKFVNAQLRELSNKLTVCCHICFRATAETTTDAQLCPP
jgi:hypothetical protein